MALVHSFENSGNVLFKYRGQIPLLLFFLSIPAVYFTDYQFLDQCEGVDLFLLITCAVFSFSGQVIRAIAIGTSNKHTSGRNTKEQVAEALNTKGIYSTVRHPLYLGNYFMWIGIVMYTYNIWFITIVSLLFWLYYERIMFAEERFLERKFGQQYVDWSLSVPAFWPNLKRSSRPCSLFSMRNWHRTPLPTRLLFTKWSFQWSFLPSSSGFKVNSIQNSLRWRSPMYCGYSFLGFYVLPSHF
jgi:protein-S-isoprenylcysteine O-methyltransferase Ste14